MAGTGALQRLSVVVWAILPFFIALVSVMLYAAPLRIGSVSIPMPLFPFMVIYFWSMTRPEFMPWIAIFLTGLFQDVLTGGPVGLWALTYLLSTAIISTQTEVLAGRGRTALWAGFVIAIVAASFMAWVFARIALGTDPSFGRLGIEILVTLLTFPLAGKAFALVQRATNHARRLTVNSTMARI